MRQCYEIADIRGREILDSRGDPTTEAEVYLSGGVRARASVPSGASTGFYEAAELRDEEPRYSGRGVRKAVSHINGEIRRELLGADVREQAALDSRLISLDGTNSKGRLGANAILAVSLACARAAAKAAGMPLYRYVGGAGRIALPVPMMNVLNGGAHADNGLDIQEFMIQPVGELPFSERLRMCAEVFHALKKVVKSAGVGDEGGYAPELGSDESAVEALMRGVELAGFVPGKDFVIAIDAAASGWYHRDKGRYIQPKSGRSFTSEQLVRYWADMLARFPIVSLEDGCADEDIEGWGQLTEAVGKGVQLVGDDLFVTNTERIKMGVRRGIANAVLIKPNQIGTLTETIEAVRLAKESGYACVMSHRSGETEDTSIADLAVGLDIRQIKMGAPSRTDRVAKYNRLLRIEEMSK